MSGDVRARGRRELARDRARDHLITEHFLIGGEAETELDIAMSSSEMAMLPMAAELFQITSVSEEIQATTIMAGAAMAIGIVTSSLHTEL